MCVHPSGSINMLTFVSSLHIIVIMTLMPAVTMELTTDINCTELEFLNVKDDIIHTTVGRDINVTFSLRFTNCSSNDDVLVKIEKKSENNIIPAHECKILYNQSMCSLTSSSPACICTSATAPATFITRFSETGNFMYTWTWLYNQSTENERTVTFVVSGDSMNFSLNMIIVGSIVGSLAVITVGSVVICLILCQKSVKKTAELSPRARKWSGDSRDPSGKDQGKVSKMQHLVGQYQEVHDSLFHQKIEKNLYSNRSGPGREWNQHTSRHNISQDRADLIRQSSGSVYGQVYDVLMLQTATADASPQPMSTNKR